MKNSGMMSFLNRCIDKLQYLASDIITAFQTSKSPFFQKVALLASGSIFCQILNFLVSPVLTRLYSPHEFGILSNFSAVVSIALGFALLGFEDAILLPKEKSKAANLLAVAFFSVCIVSITITGLLVYFFDLIFPSNSFWSPYQVVPFFFLILFGGSCYIGLSSWAMREQKFAILAKTKVSQTMLQLSSQIILGTLNAGVLGLIVGQLFQMVGGVFSLLRFLILPEKDTFKMISLHSMKDAVLEYAKIAFARLGSVVCGISALPQLIPILLAKLYGAEVVGFFYLADRIQGIPGALIGSAMGQVFFSESAERARSRPDTLKRFYFQTARNFALLALGPALGMFFWGKGLITTLFGNQWIVAGEYFQLLSPLFFFQFIGTNLSTINIVTKFPGRNVSWAVMRSILVLGMFYCFYLFHISSLEAILYYSGGMSLSYVCLMLVNYLSVTEFSKRNEGSCS